MNVYLQIATKIRFPLYFRYLLYTLSDDIMNMQILFSLSEIGGIKSKNPIFNVIFLNKDISVTTLDITMKFSMRTPHIHSEGKVSQIFHLCPSFSFM